MMNFIRRKIDVIIILTILFIINNINNNYASAQAENNIEKIKQHAEDYYDQMLFKNALVLFLQVYESNPKDAVVNYKIGVCYLNTIYKSKSIEYLEKVAGLNGEKMEIINLDYYLGRAYHYNHEFDKAIHHYKRYINILDPKKEDEAGEIVEIKRYTEMCENGKKILAHPVDVKINHLNGNINSGFADFLPIVSADGNSLFFGSRRHITSGGKYDPLNQEYFEDIFISNKHDGNWQPAKPIGENVNNVLHEGPLSLSEDGKKLFLYKSDNANYCHIYYSNFLDNEWSAPISMGNYINSGDMETGGSISPDGQRFYFSSDREGGYGQMDIYFSELQSDGSWGPPINMGPEINTPYNEDSPYAFADGKTLYFSSDGHNSIGGFDLFTSTYNKIKQRWSVPANLGFPINTADDEISISMSKDGRQAYYSAYKEDSFGDEDIYLITSEELISGAVLNSYEIERSDELISGAEINSYEIKRNNFTDLRNNLENLSSQSDSNPLFPGKILNEKVHFACNDSKIITEYSRNNINKVINMLVKFPEIKIQINGYSDNKGSKEYNLKLSEKRAQTVYEYLISNGIDKNRLSIKGCGSSSLHPGHNLKDRRVEFMIINNTIATH